MQVAKEKSIASGLHNSTGYVFLSSATTKSFLICHDGGSESATSSQVHTPVEAQQQGKPSASDCQVPADGCELPLSAKMTEASHNSANLSVSSFVLKKLELQLSWILCLHIADQI